MTSLSEYRQQVQSLFGQSLPETLRSSLTVSRYAPTTGVLSAVLDTTALKVNRTATQQAVTAALSALPGVERVELVLTAAKAEAPRPHGVNSIIAVGSGKGGVGKSTVTVNLAAALQASGLRVGLLDGDIYGPSQGHLLGTTERLPQQDNQVIPQQAHGLLFVSMANLVDQSRAIIWRGPMVMKAIKQFLFDVKWDINGEIDVLLVDLPPGTGDVALTLVQSVRLSGALVVSTLQELAMLDVRKAEAMFAQLSVPLIGLVANMDGYACPACGHHSYPFTTREDPQQTPIVRIPLSPALMAASEQGIPLMMSTNAAPVQTCFQELAGLVQPYLQATDAK